MLGRLRMSVDEAMDWFQEVVSWVFSKKKRWGNGSFKATNLEIIVERMVSKHAGDSGTSMKVKDNAHDRGCKTVVCAMSAHAMRGVTLFRSYKYWENEAPDCSIVQAVRATTAQFGLFKPVDIFHHGVKLSFVDSSFGSNNPAAHMLDEAKSIFPGRDVGCIISVGTGQTIAADSPASRRIGWSSSNEVVQTLQRIATDSEKTSQELQVRFKDTPGVYFRFNVEQGLQDTNATDPTSLPQVAAHTMHHNQLVEVKAKLQEAVKAAVSGGTLIPTTHLDGSITRMVTKARIKICPPPSMFFTGQSTVLTQMEDYFTEESNSRHVFVLHGLGGSGKTQIALKFVEQNKHLFWDVFYVDASSAETISAHFKAIALVKGAGDTTNDALSWFAEQEQKWLIIFNNADSTSLDLKQYFPACSHGNILVTTRNHQLINLAGEIRHGMKAECLISGMSPEDANELLIKASSMSAEADTTGSAMLLVKYTPACTQELGFLALAIIQAGAYIHVNDCTIEEYLMMYRRNKLILEEYRKILPKPSDYDWTVFTTWHISYEKLSGGVARLLHILGFLHHEGITEAIFQNACERMLSYQSELVSSAQDRSIRQTVIEFLKSSFCTQDSEFNKLAFLDSIRELRSYSLVEFNPLDRTYSVHSLVQNWVREIIVKDSSTTCASTALVLAFSIRYDEQSPSGSLTQRHLLPHINTVMTHSNAEPYVSNAFAWVYQQNRLWKPAELLLNVALEASKRLLGEHHPTTLYNTENLAATLCYQEQWTEAESLREQAVKTCRQALGNNHVHTLWATNNLALQYSEQQQFDKAETLHASIFEAKKRENGPHHPDTLRAAGNLAITCVDLGQLDRAARLQEFVYKTFQQSAGPQHPDTLTSMEHLAITLAKQRKFKESLDIQDKVLTSRRNILGPRHRDTEQSIYVKLCLTQQMFPTIRVPTPSTDSSPVEIKKPNIELYYSPANGILPGAHSYSSSEVSSSSVDIEIPNIELYYPTKAVLPDASNTNLDDRS
ncbi:nephrocystin-3 protein [Ceratobasidium sp. AG-Ba]|nr:nephrocystin-3 protein [Ceratobasidium sp. AG-Ba]